MRHLLLGLLVLVATSVSAADIDTVRQNYIGYYTGAGADVSAPRMKDALAALEAEARNDIRPGFLLANGSWSDINYSETPSGTWSPWEHTKRLVVMAKAYRTPGQGLYHDQTLRGQIEAALSYTGVYYGLKSLPTGNWWFWTIGVPLDLGPTLVLMRADIDPTVYSNCVQEIYLRIGSSPTSRGIVGPVPTGENLAWSCFMHLTLGLLKDDASLLAPVRDAMASVTMASASAEGIKPDASFQQHGSQLYTGGYGGSFANDVAQYTLLTRGTGYALPPASLASFNDYLADGVIWSLYGNYFDVSVISREVARPSTSGFNGLAALLQGSTVVSPRQHEIESAAAKMLQSWGGLPIELAGLATNIEQSGIAAAWPAGHRHYWMSDYAVHRRDGWFASVKMFSTRTKSGENTNNENLLGSRQSDGRLYLVRDGDTYYTHDVWPALDWTRLPGITVEQNGNAANDSYGYGSNRFAGGVSDGTNGIAAMQLAPLGTRMTANKSWFFFDDAIVCLAGAITSADSNHVETIVNQWPVRDASSQLIVDGTASATRWALLDGIGYFFPTPAPLQTKRETRSGTWAALGGSTDTTPRTADVVTLWIDHGPLPMDASTEYVIAPNATADTLRAWSANPPVSILANDYDVAAVRDLRTNALGIVFFTTYGNVNGYTADAPAIVYAVPNGSLLTLHVADPTGNSSGVLHVTVPGSWSTADAKVVSATSRATTLEIPRSGGQTTSVTLTPLAIRRRAAQH
ncbi:MAG TPA: polysaccharide lyase family 8 super-sandwich domain-containing protein [Thermoanaerobaculia bacterium]